MIGNDYMEGDCVDTNAELSAEVWGASGMEMGDCHMAHIHCMLHITYMLCVLIPHMYWPILQLRRLNGPHPHPNCSDLGV